MIQKIAAAGDKFVIIFNKFLTNVQKSENPE